MNHIDTLYECVQTRPRPQDVAEVILDVLNPSGWLQSTLDKAAASSLKRLGRRYSSMASDFARPVGMYRPVKVASELFHVPALSSADCLDPEKVEAFIRSVSGQLAKSFGQSDFKVDRLNREQRKAELSRGNQTIPVGHRAYNKRFRLLIRMEERLTKLAWERRKYLLTRTGKSALAVGITREDLGADLNTACFVAYQSARMSMRSKFTNGSQERAFDDVASALFKLCQDNATTTRWDVVASVLPDQEVLRHLTDDQKGDLLGRTWNLLADAADFLATCHAKDNLDLRNMIVRRGNDSSTWNQAAGGWNKAREHWINLVHAMGMEGILTDICPGKVLRLMAADVVGWHGHSKGGLDSSLHPDTKVWRSLPLPWEVVRGEAVCSRSVVELVCAEHGVDPKSWTGVKEGREPVPFKPTPELVHGVSVSSPDLAKALRKAGVFSGKASRMGADLPPFVVDRDESGAATGAHEGK